MAKTYPNTPKGRDEIKTHPAAYNLKNKNGEIVYTGMSNNPKRRIKEHHRDSSKHFASVSVTYTRTRNQANNIENNRLHRNKPKLNKKPT